MHDAARILKGSPLGSPVTSYDNHQSRDAAAWSWQALIRPEVGTGVWGGWDGRGREVRQKGRLTPGRDWEGLGETGKTGEGDQLFYSD